MSLWFSLWFWSRIFFAKFTHHCTSVSLTLPTISPTDGIEMKSKHSGRKREIGLFASMLLEKLSLRLVKDMTLGNGRRMSLLTAMTIYNFLLHLIGAIQKSMCTFEINKENVFLWNKYFLFQKHFDQMSKIFQDQEHLSKNSF